MKKLGPILALMGCCLLLPAHSKEVSILEKVPSGMYVHTENPECGIESSFLDTLKDPDILAAVQKTFGVRGSAALIVITQADTFFKKNGSAASTLYNKAVGRRDGASCATVCLRPPAKAEVLSISLSDRNGKTKFVVPFRDGQVLDNQTTFDWSGWRAVTTATDEKGTIVCGVATNWDANRDALKRMAVQYRLRPVDEAASDSAAGSAPKASASASPAASTVQPGSDAQP